ncbi:PadR family transcriptional regulator [Cohnella abietis]|uniref:PadR family transcriptional regulator n=1 Tax=Cohnella abietis TaxID=2507935 RepID=A0A3T1D833_9BACL|nr:PadR family transcriptional regulator [Cohnella abietis]BBI34240.1 PadR family transcriptional regulator [Cohnella abietis]
MNVQFKKGVLDLCVLALTAWEDRYGYELAVMMSSKFEVAVGSVYPLLNRLTLEGYFSTYLKESAEGPARKYYKLTERGHKHLMELTSEWRSFSTSVDQLIKEGVER